MKVGFCMLVHTQVFQFGLAVSGTVQGGDEPVSLMSASLDVIQLLKERL